MITIIPHVGVGALTFHMTRSEVCAAVGHAPRHIKSGPYYVVPAEVFDGFIVHYDVSDRCCAVEFGRGIRSIFYGSRDLFDMSAIDALNWAMDLDPGLRRKNGFESIVLGLSMYAPWIDDDDLDAEDRLEKAETFLVFRHGYYVEERKRLGIEE